MNLLRLIINNKKEELAQRKISIPEEKLQQDPVFSLPRISLVESLKKKQGLGIIAEYKRRSPSAGMINRVSDPGTVAAAYAGAGAAGVSVLTDLNYFGGTTNDLLKARQNCSIPLLRKDFIIDTYQVTEARAAGADAILLIAAVLTYRDALKLSRFAYENGLEVLMEFHNEEELALMNDHISVAGINNRNLATLKVDTAVSHRLYKYLPGGVMKISESGISSAAEILRLRKTGYDGYLVGETFMSTDNPALRLKKLIDELKESNKS